MAEKRGEEASSNPINKLILKKAVHKRIDQILAKAFISEKEIYDLVRTFFKKYLEVDYEFTHQEIIKELRKVYLSPEVQEKVSDLFSKISEIEHTSKVFPRTDLEKLLAEFKEVVDDLIVSHYQKHKSFIKKIKDSIHKTFSRKHESLLDNEKSVLSENERVIVKMNILLDNAKRWSDTDLKKAKQAYKELFAMYNSLEEDRKKAYFTPVQELFNILKSKGT